MSFSTVSSTFEGSEARGMVRAMPAFYERAEKRRSAARMRVEEKKGGELTLMNTST